MNCKYSVKTTTVCQLAKYVKFEKKMYISTIYRKLNAKTNVVYPTEKIISLY